MSDNLGAFAWAATPGANRYELYADPDGAGPMPEAKADDFNEASGTGFSYFSYTSGTQGFRGNLHWAVTASSVTASLNATYRLRACDASGCGAFTESKAYDLVNGISHEFASGRVPLKPTNGYDGVQRLSKDGLTLATRTLGTNADLPVYVFTRSSSAQPWQQQAALSSGKGFFPQQIALSADGNTLAVGVLEQSSTDTNYNKGVVYVYHRSGGTWNQQAYLEAPSAPSACPQPCRADITDNLTLSADGNLLAASSSFSSSSGVGNTSINAVVTYSRNGATWKQQASLDTGGKLVSAMALSSDGSTLAVNDGALNPLGSPLTTTTPFVVIFSQQGNGTWSQQARIPAGIHSTVTIGASAKSTMTLSDNGDTLAIQALNVPGHQTPELDIKSAALSCGSSVVDDSYIALYSRNSATWQRQTAISRSQTGGWALASDGNALFYGGSLFTRNSGTWTCP